MDAIRQFEVRHVSQIRQALIAYRQRFKVGDVIIAKEINRQFLPDANYESVRKNLERLRRGEHIRNPQFLNACVRFLEVKLATSAEGPPPEAELAAALRRYTASFFNYDEFWKLVDGDYAVHMARQGRTSPDIMRRQAGFPVGIPVMPEKLRGVERSFSVLSINAREAKDYAPVTERYFMREDNEAEGGEPRFSEPGLLQRKGVCLPLSQYDVLVMIRDFLFSHMYLLRREALGFTGAMVMAEPFATDLMNPPSRLTGARYDVLMQRTAWPRALTES